MEKVDAGEISINSIDQDGMMKGYNIELIKNILNSFNIPVNSWKYARFYKCYKK